MRPFTVVANHQREEVNMAVQTDPTKHWCRKMRTHWQSTVGKKDYITEEEVVQQTHKVVEVYPELDLKELLEQSRHSWVNDLNCGMKPPEGYRLTEAQFVQNMWLAIHKPSFKERTREMTIKIMERLDKDKRGYVTKNEYLRMTSKLVTEDVLKQIFDALDESGNGKVTREAMERAYVFFFTDTENEEHPFNFLRGPLVD